MKRLFTYIATLLLFAACTSEEAVIDNVTGREVASIFAEIEDPVGFGKNLGSRATLVYDDAKNIMAFKWDDEDHIGVFTKNESPTHRAQQEYTQVKDDPANTDNVRAFQTPDGAVHVDKNYQYVSYFPYSAAVSDYANVPVDYTGQVQTEPVDFSYYWYDKNDEAYKASQPMASAHLPKYDFLCTGVTNPTPTGGIYFKLNRMGAIVRIWLVIDSKYNYVYDEMQLVNNTKMFTTKATMDAENLTLTPTEQSHIINLKFGTADAGFDLTEMGNDGTRSTSPFYDWYNGKYTGYILAYMMLGPIDLKGTSENPSDPGYVEKSFVYLVAHEKANPEKKHYFKSSGLAKPNLTPNAFYNWTVYPNEDTPIEVSEITVEQWREGTTFDNGNGNGTATW